MSEDVVMLWERNGSYGRYLKRQSDQVKLWSKRGVVGVGSCSCVNQTDAGDNGIHEWIIVQAWVRRLESLEQLIGYSPERDVNIVSQR